MKIYKSFAFCALFLLIGCSPFEYAPDYSKDVSIDAQLRSKAIAVFRAIDGERKGGFWEDITRSRLSFSLVCEGKPPHCAQFSSTTDNEWEAKLLKEGRYKLDTVIWRIGDWIKIWSNFNVYIDVKKGEVVYIGDFVFYPSNRTIEIKNDFEKAKRSIGRTMPELASRLQEKITKVVRYIPVIE
ncbi:hypothetical protein FACS1894122_03120 [Alphaproteobacteria bacterium]|nr:hypothetical protein FACS1894122_03120 [Alphaproteobacteria bacterium]